MEFDIDMIMANPGEEVNKLEAMSNEERMEYLLKLFKQMEKYQIREYGKILSRSEIPYSIEHQSRSEIHYSIEHQFYRANEITYYEKIADTVDEKVTKLEGNIVTISYVIESSDAEYEGYKNLLTTRSGTKVECQVRVDEETGEIAEVLSAKKVEFANHQNHTGIIRNEHSKTEIISTENLSIGQVDMELLNKNFHFQREVVLPRLKTSQEACHEMLSIVKNSEKCYLRTSEVFINPNGELVENPRLSEIKSDIDFGDGDFSYEYIFEEKSRRKLENIPEEYMEDLKIATASRFINIEEAVKLLNCLHMYTIPVEELERISTEYSRKEQELKNLSFTSRSSKDRTEEISRLVSIRDTFPSEEEINEFHAKAQRDFEEKKKEYKKQHSFLGFLRKLFKKQETLMLEPPAEVKKFDYEGFSSREELESELSRMQQEQEEYVSQQEKKEELQAYVNENEKSGKSAQKILEFKRRIAREKEKTVKGIDIRDTSDDGNR